MNPADVTIEALAASETFQNYCRATNAADVAYWEEWLHENPTYQPQVAQAKKIVLQLSIDISDEEMRQEFIKFKAAITQTAESKEVMLYPVPKQTKHLPYRRRKFLQLAATLLLLVSFGFGIWHYLLAPTEKLTVWKTEFGEVQTYFLPDGSKVILNANSTLSFNKSWSASTPRIVKLQGEAFFEVKRKENLATFEVHTSNGKIEVLGTSFNVLQRAKALEVALLEGAVSLHIPAYPTIKMNPGEQVRVNGLDFFEQQEIDVDAASAWRFERLVFKETPIRKVMQRLQDEFNWKVSVANRGILDRKITATIPKNDPALLLEALSEIYDLTIIKMDDQVYRIE
ncbi:MAG: FecR domain-containing protein [Bacteroidota bacterium]